MQNNKLSRASVGADLSALAGFFQHLALFVKVQLFQTKLSTVYLRSVHQNASTKKERKYGNR